VRLGELIKRRFAVEARLIPGAGGVFDVVVDGKKLFSKHDEDRFPDEDELLDQIARL